MYTTNTQNAAVETGFYDFILPDGTLSLAAEHGLSRLEAAAADAMKRLTPREFPPTPDDRAVIAAFLAVLLARRPEVRDSHRATLAYLKDVAGESGLDEAGVKELLDRSNIQEPDQNRDVGLLLAIAPRLVPYAEAKTWILGYRKDAGFITSDHPLVYLMRSPEPTRFGVGLLTADEVYFPVDRDRVLILLNSDAGTSEQVVEVAAKDVRSVNGLQTDASYKYVFQHPGDEPLGEMMPKTPRPLGYANGTPLFSPTQ